MNQAIADRIPLVASSSEASRQKAKPLPARRIFGTIRNKIIIPFLILVLFVTMLGSFVVTRIVGANAQDRLTNQLLEAGRAASDSIVAREQRNLDTLRLAVFTIGVPEALRDHDVQILTNALLALAANQDAYMLFGLDPGGRVVADVRQGQLGYVSGLLSGQDMNLVQPVTRVLSDEVDEFGDKYAGIVQIDGQQILLTVAPVHDQTGAQVGAVAVGTPLDQILAETKGNVLADVTMYQSAGLAVETTYVLVDDTSLSALSISPVLYQTVLQDPENNTPLQEITVNGRQFQSAYAPLIVRSVELGVLGVSAPTSFITSVIATNRNSLSIMFALVATLIVVVGAVVAHGLTAPVRHLARTAKAVSAGDLTRQSGVRTADEIGVLGRIFDAMTLKLAAQNKALQQETAYLRAVIGSAADGTVVVGPDGDISHLNPAARRMITSDRAVWENIFVRLVTQIMNDDEADDDQAPTRVALDRQWIDALAAPVVSEDGGEVGVVVTMRDVTEQVLTEQMRNSFILQMSHELYTPLSALMGYIGLATTALDGADPRISKFHQEALVSAGVLKQMIGQMLDVATMIRGGLELETQPLDMALLVRESVSKFRNLIEEKDLELQLQFAALEPYEADGQRLRWAFENLVKNACLYTMPGGKISIYAGKEDGWCTLRVRDTGVGITPFDQARIFEQFYRGYPAAPDGTVIDERGTGLGLFIVDQIIRAHGGQIEIESQVGVGSEFLIRLPLSNGRTIA